MSVRALEQYKLIRQPMIWGLLALMLLILSLLFQRLCVDYLTLVQDAIVHQKDYQNVSLEIIKPLCSWSIVLLALFMPVFTAQAISQEFNHHTIYLWAMSDRSATRIILGKFFALFLFSLLIVLFLFGLLMLLTIETRLDFGLLFSALLAVILISSAFISFGLFISTLSAIPLLTIGLTLLGNGFWMMLEWLNPFGEAATQLASQFSLLSHSYHLLNGILYSPDLVFYVSFISGWLMLSAIVLKYKLRRLQG